MDILPDFGKYAPYVWTCYGLSITGLLGLTAYTVYQARKWRPKK